MKPFFKVKSLEEVLALAADFTPLDTQIIPVSESCSQVLARDLIAGKDLPGFRRSAMDGFAVAAASTFGASESSPAWLAVAGTIHMGDIPSFELVPGQAAKISTGGMLPGGADAVVMVEHTQMVDSGSVEIYKSVAPLQHVIDAAEDYAENDLILKKGTLLRPQETGLAAGLGYTELEVYAVPTVGIISTGDEVVDIGTEPRPGQIRDINTYTLGAFVRQAGGIPVTYPIVRDDPARLLDTCRRAAKETDMVMISGGSSVGARDYTVDVLEKLPDTRILVHGISLSPGKPTILARSGKIPVWGLPGQVVSAMVVFRIVVKPFIDRLRGVSGPRNQIRIPATLSRNVASAQGRTDFIRVCLEKTGGRLIASPVLGKSGLIRTMVAADGLLEIGENREGLEKGTLVEIIPL